MTKQDVNSQYRGLEGIKPYAKALHDQIIETKPPHVINWHIVYQCNYVCKFCYFRETENEEERHPNKPHLAIPVESCYRILEILKENGIKRINFAGGEPTLLPELPKIIEYAHRTGLDITIVTNSTGLTDRFISSIRGKVKAVKLSIDSQNEEIEKQLGRGSGNHVRKVIKAAETLRNNGIMVMANTVVTSRNWKEDMHDIMMRIKPERWKVFQVLGIFGQNQDHYADLSVSDEEFNYFIKRHGDLRFLVDEDNERMTESYLMLDPYGRFFQNSGQRYIYTAPLLEVGFACAFHQVAFNADKFKSREESNILDVEK